MNQKSFAGWLRVVIGGIAVIGALLYLYILPHYGSEYLVSLLGGESGLAPFMIFVWVSAVPCYIVLWYGRKLAIAIGNDRSFTVENAHILTKICYITAFDTAFYFVGALVFIILGASGSMIMFSMLIVFVGITVVVVCSTASHLVARAAEIQEENDLMI